MLLLLSGILVGFLLPKIIGVTDYGYYKTYTLYAGYAGLFHFGLADGIYLMYGGKDYDSLERNRFRFYSKVFFCLEAFVSIFVVIFSLLFLSGNMRFIFLMLSLYLIFQNINSYYMEISQATSRFKELSQRNIIRSVLISIGIIGLACYKTIIDDNITYKSYIYLFTLIIAFLAFWYIGTYRDITLGECERYQGGWQEIGAFIKVGFPLMLANLCSSLILTLDRQFVNILFDTDSYAIYAFAYNMLALVTTAVSAISTVLYPKLKQLNEETLKESYSKLVTLVLCLVFGCMLVYFPLNAFVSWYLPKYSESLPIFRIIFPGLGISSVVTIIMHNYYKALGINFLFFVKSVITLVISGIANYIAFSTFKTTISISIASIITMLFWYVFVEWHFIKKHQINGTKNFLFMLMLIMSFYLCTEIRVVYISFIAYTVSLVLIVVIFFNKQVKSIIRQYVGKNK